LESEPAPVSPLLKEGGGGFSRRQVIAESDVGAVGKLQSPSRGLW